MTAPRNVALLVGSLRSASLSRKIAHYILERAEPKLACSFAEIGDLPLYNEDREALPPAPWSRFRAQIAAADAVLFVTPEYNRSTPGALKNAIDVGSRPAGKSVFNGKPAAVLSQSPNRLGGFGANHALRQSFVFLNMPVMQQPEAYVGESGQAFDDSGAIKVPEVARLLDTFIERFAAWIPMVSRNGMPGDLGQFLERRQRIARDYVNGDGDSFAEILTKKDPATFFAPDGGTQTGAADIAQRTLSDARRFVGPGATRIELLQSDAGALAFWTGVQHARVRIAGSREPVEMRLRVTEVFRIEGGEWKLIHRHADIPASG